jgi:hypothetical protein
MEFLCFALVVTAALMTIIGFIALADTRSSGLKTGYAELTVSMWIGAGVVWFIGHWPV